RQPRAVEHGLRRVGRGARRCRHRHRGPRRAAPPRPRAQHPRRQLPPQGEEAGRPLQQPATPAGTTGGTRPNGERKRRGGSILNRRKWVKVTSALTPGAATLTEVVSAIGELARQCVEASAGSELPIEQNLAMFPASYLKEIAGAHLANQFSTTPHMAANRLGEVAVLQCQRGRYQSGAFTIRHGFTALMLAALRPYCYHVAGALGSHLMRCWSLACSRDDGSLV